MFYPPYSPDIAPSDYWLFRRMQQVTDSLLSQKSKIGSQRRVIFSRWNSKIVWEMGKSIGSDGQYFNWSVHSFCFEINAFFAHKKTDRTNLYSQYLVVLYSVLNHLVYFITVASVTDDLIFLQFSLIFLQLSLLHLKSSDNAGRRISE